jgi:hypothetical protein
MWTILLVALELLMGYACSTHYIAPFAILIYFIFWYTSSAAQTGNDAKPGFRSWRVWKAFTAVKYTISNEEEFRMDRQLLFILTSPNITQMALISGFGFHGGIFDAIDVRYIVPSILLKIPLLREILLWSGAVSAPGLHGRDPEGTILQLLKKGKSVAYQPHALTADVFNFAREHKIHIVPVCVNGESERYIFWHPPIVRVIQSFFMRHIQYALPLIFMPNIFGSQPPPKLEVVIGVPLNPTLHADSEGFQKLFQGQINGFNI